MLERWEGAGVGALGSQEPIEGRLRAIVFALEARPDPDFAQQLHGGLEEMHHEAQLIAGELVEEGQGLRGVKARPAEELAHVRPVFLFDVGIIVFLVGPAASELDLARLTVADEMVNDKLAAIVGVEPAQGEGESGRHLRKRLADRALALAKHGARFDPGGMDVGEIEGLQAAGTCHRLNCRSGRPNPLRQSLES
jgi:hypothetical protein